MLFSEWHLDYRGALFTITVNTSFFTIALLSLSKPCTQNKEGISAVMWISGIQSLLCGYSQDLGGKNWRCIKIWEHFISTIGYIFVLIVIHHHYYYYCHHDAPPLLLLHSNIRIFSSRCIWSFEMPYQNVTHGNFLPNTPYRFYPLYLLYWHRPAYS